MEQVDEVARGRVWSGQDAVGRGLVDELGGLTAAIAKAKELANLEDDVEVRLVTYPMADASFPFLGVSSGASAAELKAVGDLAKIVNSPEAQALLMEIESARDVRLQARMGPIGEY